MSSSEWSPVQPSLLNVITTVTVSPALLTGQVSWRVTSIHPARPGPKDWDPRRGVCGCSSHPNGRKTPP